MPAQQRDRSRVGGDLVRQLAAAFSSYLLFPGDTSRPAFRAAVDRVAEAARPLVAGGPFDVRIRSARFVLPDGEVVAGETVERFGLACFDRGIEHLRVHAVPSAEDLVRLGELLARPSRDVADEGGAGLLLRGLGVTSLTVGEVLPDDEVEVDGAIGLGGLGADERFLWERLDDPPALAAALLDEGLPEEPAAAAHALYVRFRALEEALPDRLTARRELFARVRRVLEHLPVAVGREFHAIVLTRLASERFAMRFGVALTDQELVDVLFDLEEYGGPDPSDLGRRVVALTDRKEAVLGLIDARRQAAGAELSELAAGEEATLVALALADATSDVRIAVADALAEQLVAVSGQDAIALRELFPSSADDRRTVGLLALRDYVAVETDRVSVERVLAVWAAEVRAALDAGDERLADRLLDLLSVAVPDTADVSKRDAAARARASVPTPDLVRELLARTSQGPQAVAAVLGRLGEGSLRVVLDLLAEEEAAGPRAQLLALAASLAPAHLDVVAERLSDERWYVVRNLVTILGRAGRGDAVLTRLGALVTHPEAAVRRELVRSLVAVGGADAATYLRRLADDDDAQVATAALHTLGGIRTDTAAQALADVVRTDGPIDQRHAALDVLAAHPTPTATGLVAELAARQGEARLPAPLRRHARRVQRSRMSGAT